jgi:hypothetical protein
VNATTAGPLVLGRDETGEFLLSAEMLAARFGWPAQTLRNHMRRGLVVSRVERGEGKDAGRWRLSVRCGNRRWQTIIDEDGSIHSQQFETLSTGSAKA